MSNLWCMVAYFGPCADSIEGRTVGALLVNLFSTLLLLYQNVINLRSLKNQNTTTRQK